MNIGLLLVSSLAVWRISRMVALEEGPFSMFAWLRGKVDPNQQTWLGRGVACVPCVSFWAALIAALAMQLSIVEWLGISGAVLLLHRWSQ